MHIDTPKIPFEFLHTLPEGIKYLSRNNREFLVIERLACPAGHSLMVDSVRLHGEPSIVVAAGIGKASGLLYIDSYWGSHKKLYDFIPDLSTTPVVVDASCPFCKMGLMVDRACPEPGCGTKRHILLTLPGRGNRIEVCGRLGCPGHHIVIQSLPAGLTERVSNINYFGNNHEEAFGGI